MLTAIAHGVLFVVLGAIVGAAGGVFGIGGGLIAIPMLAIVFGLDQQHAQGTALVMGAPNTLVGLWRYAQHEHFDRRGATLLGIAGGPGTFAGAYFAVHFAGHNLRPAFGVFLVVLAVFLTVRTLRASPAPAERVVRHPAWIALLGLVAGTLSGVFSSGGAAFAVPFLSTYFGYAQATAQGMALGLVAPGSVIAMITYGFAGAIDWPIAIPLALGGTLFIKQGVGLAHRLPERTLRLLFGGLLVVSAIALFRTH